MAIVQTAQAGLRTIPNVQGYVDGLADRYVLRVPNVKGIGGFVFDYEGDGEVELAAEITDHYAEDNTAIQDHVALKPPRLVLSGFVGELAFNINTGVFGIFTSLQTKLTAVPAYLGAYTPGALVTLQRNVNTAQNTVNRVSDAVSRASNIVGLLAGSTPGATKQQRAYAQLESLMTSRQIIAVETPYKIFDNMIIEGLRLRQPEATKEWSDVVVTLKQMRFVDIIITENFAAKYAGRAALQAQPQVDKGKTGGQPVPNSVLFNVFNP